MSQIEKKSGTGSIWNVNNWHWENKNYTEIGKDYLTHKIEGHSFARDDLNFTLSRVSKINGEAQINIRKGKQIVIYEYELEAEFRAESEVDECTGNFRVTDINESDLDFEVVSINLTKEGSVGNKARTILKKCLKDELIKLVRNMTSDLMDLETNAEKLAKDKQLREQNDALVAEITKAKGDEKERLLAEQKKQEEEMRAKNS